MRIRSLRSGLPGRTGILAGLLALVTLLPLPRPARADLALAPADARLLRQGGILFKADLPTAEMRRGAMGGTAMALLNADPETVWQTLLDFHGHAGLFPRLKRSDVIEHAGGRTLVRYLVTVGPFAFRFFLNNYADHGSHLLRWELDKSRDNGLFRDHWGYWKVEPCEEGVLVTYAMGGRTSLPTFLTQGAGRDGTIQMLDALKERVERQELTPPRPPALARDARGPEKDGGTPQ